MLNFWFVGGVALLMIFFAIAVQVALHISETQNGMYTSCNTELLQFFESPQVLLFPLKTFSVLYLLSF